jgi:hypothetical protein
MLKNSYWNNQGTFESAAKELNKLIPVEGSVDKPRSTNKKLEKFRKACNCYHDLYNNGLGNRAQEFRQVFGIASSHYKTWRLRMSFMSDIYVDTEKVMDTIVINAAEEQGLALAADNPRVEGEYA